MPAIAYRSINIGPAKLEVIEKANEIIAEYQEQGFELTLRQLYYQFVARGLIPNRQSEYKRLGDVLNDGRMAGLIDWLAIVDRTRNLRSHSSWETPADIIESAAASYARDWWAGQDTRVEVWIEKDALVGVIEPICGRWQLPYFSCRGYTSQSEMWSAAMRFVHRSRADAQRTLLLHLGDHDPSGIDMSRDIEDRITLFMGSAYRDDFELRRIALNMNQVRQYNPPPNPAKLTDSRCEGYIREHGSESWELDALEPTVLAALIEGEIMGSVDLPMFRGIQDEQEEEKGRLVRISKRWDEVVEVIEE